jgi:hypothetical protein
MTVPELHNQSFFFDPGFARLDISGKRSTPVMQCLYQVYLGIYRKVKTACTLQNSARMKLEWKQISSFTRDIKYSRLPFCIVVEHP